MCLHSAYEVGGAVYVRGLDPRLTQGTGSNTCSNREHDDPTVAPDGGDLAWLYPAVVTLTHFQAKVDELADAERISAESAVPLTADTVSATECLTTSAS